MKPWLSCLDSCEDGSRDAVCSASPISWPKLPEDRLISLVSGGKWIFLLICLYESLFVCVVTSRDCALLVAIGSSFCSSGVKNGVLTECVLTGWRVFCGVTGSS